jgi:hypothetical protein
MTQWLLQN